MGQNHSFLKVALLKALKLYQYVLGPLWVGHTCRFEPTCSAYCVEAVETHGIIRGLWLSIKRLSRCHPWGQGGLDIVPKKGK